MRQIGLLLVVLAGMVGFPNPASGQELVARFRNARLVKIADEWANRRGMHLEALPPAHLPTRGDTLAAWMVSRGPQPQLLPPPPPPPPPFTVDSVYVFGKLERVLFLNRFGNTRWAFMQGRRREDIDTTSTADVRARLQAHFGDPTVTLAELDSVRGRAAEELIQFEYWMLVNDSIPVMVLDVNGPLTRGVVVATDARWRESLDAIRYGLLNPLFTDPRGQPYVDYFYQVDTATWYASGFDGATFFHRRIDRPDLKLGRPRLSEYVSRDQNR